MKLPDALVIFAFMVLSAKGNQKDLHQKLHNWIDEFEWSKLGKNFCQCENYKSKAFCDSMRSKANIKCLTGKHGSKLLVKSFRDEGEVQAKYNPTPSRGVSFIRYTILSLHSPNQL